MKTAPPMAIASPAPQVGSTGHAVASGNWAVASTGKQARWPLEAASYVILLECLFIKAAFCFHSESKQR